MQTIFNFERENFLTSIFFTFLSKKYFNFFLSFAITRSSFVILELPENVFDEVVDKLRKGVKDISYYEKGHTSSYENHLTICLNLHSFSGGGFESELYLLDFIKNLTPQGITFLALKKERIDLDFTLNDLKSRIVSATNLGFKSENPIDFYDLAEQFLLSNGIKIEQESLRFMMLHINRDISSFSIFIEELISFIEQSRQKVTRQNFKIIYEKYEQRRSAGNI